MTRVLKTIIFCLIMVAFAGFVSAADCWDYGSQTNCEGSTDCQWFEDPWGSWCEEKGCWNFWTETGCSNATNTINKSCNWQTTSSGWCNELDCWAFDGTNKSACENNTYGIECNYIDTYNSSNHQFPCMGPPEKECWNQSTESACNAVGGCNWGVCMKLNCWDYSGTSKTTCESKVGFNGKSCEWKTYSWGSECMEQGCWNYDNKTSCEANSCEWDGHCRDLVCNSFSGQNESYCEDNSANLSCMWDDNGKWCSDQGCWNYDQNNCNNVSGCFWETHDGGWCEELGCWNWDGNQANCENLSLHPGINCSYDNFGGWCYENIASKSCSDINSERDCMDTFYCWWDHANSTCNDPQHGVIETDFVEWNPGCYIFDMDQGICQNTTGCNWNNGLCETDTNIIPDEQLNCSLINNQTVCNSIPALSTCCSWQAGACVADRFDQSCREQMQEPPEGAYYCEDYVAYTDKSVCEQIAGDPWFMPCKWNNNSERCEFKGDDVFGDGEKNIMKLDNEQNCEAAGGKWILDTYPSTNDPETAVRLSMGRCDYKFDEERNCDKDCFACEYKTDKTAWSTKQKAKEACIESKLGICGFIEDSTAPNGYGFCEPKDEFKHGLVSGDCDDDCGACTYKGDPTASQGNRPSDYCESSGAKCKWISDPAHPDDESFGRCATQAEKTCEDKCDKCYSESTCKSVGGKQGDSNAAAVCEWSNGICQYKSGANEMEVCWDGIDNNGDNKIDCADSMCWSDPFCGGDIMFNDFGKDCFIYDDDPAGCAAEGCVYVNETWGSWCDMPGAVCWKKDGTNQSNCEQGGTCEWHSGFGGFCEQDWDMGGVANACFDANNETACNALASQNCTWVVDDWCNEGGGLCDPDPTYSGAWYDCPQHDKDGNETCESHPECNWYIDPWCQQQGSNAGFCDHKAFACWQYDDNRTECENTTNSEWCVWIDEPWTSEGGLCEGKMMSGESGSCWDQHNQTSCDAAGCKWMSGFCDPPGFGGEFMPGMPGGPGDAGGMGGFGMQCFLHDGDQTACENQTGCGWFNEPQPFCDINFESNCPQYTYNRTVCEGNSKCMWNPTGNFCDEKPFECFWNTTLWGNEAACNAHPLCYWPNDTFDNHCHPIGFNTTTQTECQALGESFRWVTGWCNPAMAAEFFGGMEMGGPPTPLGTDPDDSITDEVDIHGFGIKDMGKAFGFGITVDSMENAAACNDVKMPSGTGIGTNTTTFYWYLDTDGNTTNNCKLNHDSGSGGYEFYIKNQWTYDSNSGSVTESPSAYRCSDGEWSLAEIRVGSEKHLMCSMVGGGMIALEKTELEKFPSLYTPGVDFRVAVASADANGNVTNPTDSASPGWMSPGSQDFELPDLYGYETDWIKKASMEGADAGFIEYGEEADCWTEAGCEDYACKGHAYCVENKLGVEAVTWTDTRVPKIIGLVKETYPDGALLAYFTDKPANGTLFLYGTDSNCLDSSLTDTVYDVGIINNNSKEHKLEHLAELYDDNGTSSLNYSFNAGATYYYKLKVCDDEGKCGTSKCSNFTTEQSQDDCAFCKFVSRIKAPTGWNVYYDLDQDGSYEHWQGHVLGLNDGMFTNYTAGRKANILLNTTDGTAHMEFINTTLTKTGMSPKIRDIELNTSLKEGTMNTAEGEEVGYVGMIEETRDKIIHNLYPEVCRIKIPGAGTCDALWHCDNDGENCIDRTAEATLINTTTTSCIWQLPSCEFSTWAGGQPGTPSSSSASGGGTGGGSGGSSGGISGGGASMAGLTATHVFVEITSGKANTMNINKSAVAFTKNVFIANKDLNNVKVTVTRVTNESEMPATVRNAYQYVEIKSSDMNNEAIKEAAITFKVGKNWLANNGYKNVLLLRYDNGWKQLQTELISEDSDYEYYKATALGFGSFAVVGGERAVEEFEYSDEEYQDRMTGKAVAQTQAKSNLWVALFFLVLVAAAVYVVAKKRE